MGCRAKEEAVRGVEEDELAQANSEMRFLTMELMKVAAQRGLRFKDVLDEFIKNVYVLETTIKRKALKHGRRKAKKRSQRAFGTRQNR